MKSIKHSAFSGNIFRFPGENCILNDKDLGIAGSRLSVLTPPSSVCGLRNLQACPWSNTAFGLDIRFGGEKIRAQSWDWLPNALYRRGMCGTLAAESVTAVPGGMRAVILKVALTNRGADSEVPLQVLFSGNTEYTGNWEFSVPGATRPSPASVVSDGVTLRAADAGGESGWVLSSSLPGMKLFGRAHLWENTLPLRAGETAVCYFTLHTGRLAEAERECASVCGRQEQCMEDAFGRLESECVRLFSALPSFESDDPALNAFYYRSLVTYLLNRWEIPELAQSPWYSTGSVTGGCMCSYLWDYSGGMMLHPVADPLTNKNEIKAFLQNDLTRSYAVMPVDGKACGPWYPVNQEKIIAMVYYHVKHTGDAAFLREQAGEHTVLGWMLVHAYAGDDPAKPAGLTDYGEAGKSHLELRHEPNYKGVMPDLNARRYMSYMRAYELTVLAGEPDERLTERAAELKEALKELWNEEAGWYDFISDGVRETRYTVQMYKFFGSPVTGEETRRRLAAHLNEEEFLSPYGLHSMSKLDPAYDQEDIDNGGGGICTLFVPAVASRLYGAGYGDLACGILSRVLWWGERTPYMGDSFAANMIACREDTPLQATIGSVSCAQGILFDLFGVSAAFDGTVTVSPAAKRPAKTMKASNFRLRGHLFDIELDENSYSVKTGRKTYTAAYGTPVTLPPLI